jgi:hypothetical protein
MRNDELAGRGRCRSERPLATDPRAFENRRTLKAPVTLMPKSANKLQKLLKSYQRCLT